jgi:hypothetical protein
MRMSRTPNALVNQRATTAVLPANPLRAFVYCVIASPGKGQPLALSRRDYGRRHNRCARTISRSPAAALGKHRYGLGLFGSNGADFLHRACHSSIPNAVRRGYQIAFSKRLKTLAGAAQFARGWATASWICVSIILSHRGRVREQARARSRSIYVEEVWPNDLLVPIIGLF